MTHKCDLGQTRQRKIGRIQGVVSGMKGSGGVGDQITDYEDAMIKSSRVGADPEKSVYAAAKSGFF